MESCKVERLERTLNAIIHCWNVAHSCPPPRITQWNLLQLLLPFFPASLKTVNRICEEKLERAFAPAIPAMSRLNYCKTFIKVHTQGEQGDQCEPTEVPDVAGKEVAGPGLII